MNRQTKSVRLEEETISVIDDNLVGPNRRFTSIPYFIERSVSNQASSVLSLIVDGDTLRKLIRHLNNIGEINEKKPMCSTDARWGDESFDNPVEFRLSEKTLGQVNQSMRKAGLDQSVIFRICIFKHLCEISNHPSHPFDYDWKAKEIKCLWQDIEDSLVSIQTQFYEILLRRFVIASDGTLNSIQNDRTQFNHFAEIYHKEFYETETYEQIADQCGDQALLAVETTIEEFTKDSFTSGDESWLGDLAETIEMG